MLTNPVTKATLFLSNQYLLLCPWDTLIFAAYNRQRNAGTTPAHKKTSSPKTEPEKLRQQNAPRHNSVFFDEVIAYYILNQQYTLTQNLYAIIISTDFCIIIYSEGELQVHTKPETLGKIIKSARQRSELTMEELAERIGITERYWKWGQKTKLRYSLQVNPRVVHFTGFDFLPRETVQRIRSRKPYPYALHLRWTFSGSRQSNC